MTFSTWLNHAHGEGDVMPGATRSQSVELRVAIKSTRLLEKAAEELG